MSKTLFINLILLLFVTVATVFAQQQALNVIEDITPLTSEFNILRLEDVAGVAIPTVADDRKIILVARLGNGERSRELNRRRLYNVQTFLLRETKRQLLYNVRSFPSKHKNISAESIVATEGEKVSGYGRVEIYVGGKLLTTLTVLKNEDLMVDCCEGDTDFYPGKDRLRPSKRKQRQ
jgi:hypothetical protein